MYIKKCPDNEIVLFFTEYQIQIIKYESIPKRLKQNICSCEIMSKANWVMIWFELFTRDVDRWISTLDIWSR